LQAVTKGDAEKLEKLLDQGWPVDEIID